jgi:predicted flap endonuclease-1-like 5' DNA nuclease
MLEVIAQIVICLIIAALIGGVIGYLMGKNSCEKHKDYELKEKTNNILYTDNQDDFEVQKGLNLEDKELTGVTPVLLSEAREEGKDNLQLIKGIGFVLEKVLNETGIYHFDQIANLTTQEVIWLDKSMAFPGRISREEWINQAKDLAQSKTILFTEGVKKGELPNSKKS